MNTTNTGIVQFRLDPEDPPTMTPEELQALRELRDEEIDLTDIPEQVGKTDWRRAGQRVTDLISQENKQQITLRLDADLLAFFKSTGRRYQSRINAVLREYMLAQKPR